MATVENPMKAFIDLGNNKLVRHQNVVNKMLSQMTFWVEPRYLIAKFLVPQPISKFIKGQKIILMMKGIIFT